MGKAFKIGKEYLLARNFNCCRSDVVYIFEKCFGTGRLSLITDPGRPVPEKDFQKFIEMISARARGIPTQYIIGECEFMKIKVKVGKGVLIPRDDTEVLIEESVRKLKGVESPKIIDLCSGSGIIAMALCMKIKKASVIAAELSKEAYGYLCENLKINKFGITTINDDIFRCHERFGDNFFDAVVSNPPYIPEDDIDTLSEEVKNEPREALDGGKDGLEFYRKICGYWIEKIKPGGILAVEIGCGQSNDVRNIFEKHKLTAINSCKDINGIERVISAVKRAK